MQKKYQSFVRTNTEIGSIRIIVNEKGKKYYNITDVLRITGQSQRNRTEILRKTFGYCVPDSAMYKGAYYTRYLSVAKIVRFLGIYTPQKRCIIGPAWRFITDIEKREVFIIKPKTPKETAKKEPAKVVDLVLINKDGKIYADSRQVAEMTDKRHADLMRDIENYNQILENANLRSQDFFIPSSYKVNGNNKTYPCYLLTKKGCDMVANKMTGEKGVLFTAAYVTKFHAMEEELRTRGLPKDYLSALKLLVKKQEELEEVAPKVEFAEEVMATEDSIPLKNLANILAKNGILTPSGKPIGNHWLFKILREQGFLSKTQRGIRNKKFYNFPNQVWIEKNVFERVLYPCAEGIKNRPSTLKHLATTMVTAKGIKFFIDYFKKNQRRLVA